MFFFLFIILSSFESITANEQDDGEVSHGIVVGKFTREKNFRSELDAFLLRKSHKSVSGYLRAFFILFFQYN